eukprot:gene9390-10370_t
MGVEASVELSRPFLDITKWSKGRLDSVVTHYMEGEYDFGLDCNAIMGLTSYELDDAKELVAVHSRNDTGVVNAITLLITIISLANSENRNEQARLETIFDLMDFNSAGRISSDEFTILLLCAATSFACILEGRLAEDKAQTYENNALAWSRYLLQRMSKKPFGSATVKKEEFVAAVRESFFAQGVVLVNDLFTAFVQTPPPAPTANEG